MEKYIDLRAHQPKVLCPSVIVGLLSAHGITTHWLLLAGLSQLLSEAQVVKIGNAVLIERKLVVT